MITGKQNKGFTLVEVIVAIVISAFVALNLLIISGSGFKLHRNTKLTAQLEIETQMVLNNIKKTVQESKSFSYFEQDNKKAYKFEIANNKYVGYVIDEVGNIYYSELSDDKIFDIVSEDNYLGQYISAMTINGNTDYLVKETPIVRVEIKAEKAGLDNTLVELVRLRDNR